MDRIILTLIIDCIAWAHHTFVLAKRNMASETSNTYLLGEDTDSSDDDHDDRKSSMLLP